MITVEIRQSKQYRQSQYSGYVKFDYNQEIVNIMRELPFRYFYPETNEWEVPSNNITNLVNMFRSVGYDVEVKGWELIKGLNKKKIPKNFCFKTKPYNHQIEGVNKGLNCNKWFLGDEQGLGKTKQIIDIAVSRKLLYGYKHCLIVCGVNTLKWNWVNEIHTHSNEKCCILGQRKITRGKNKGKLKIGSTSDKIHDLKVLLEKDTDDYFLITNVESFRDKEFADTIRILCDKKIINMCAADEMHKMKNPSSQQTKGFLKCTPECQIGMTGTPLMNSPLDLYIILRWLGYEKHDFSSFKNHYCVMGGYGGYEIVGYKNIDQLTNQMKEIMLRRLKKDVLDLPEKTYIDEYVEMEGKQEVLYDEVKNGIKSALANGTIDISNPLSALIRLRQTTGYPGIISDEVFDSAKLDRMEDLVEEAIANEQKVIVFSNWTQMTDEICRRLLKTYPGGVTCITGDTNDFNRQSAVSRFQRDDTCKIIVGTIGAMGTGLTLTEGTVIIFVDEPWSRALYEQAVDRAHRIGQKNNITIYNLLTKDSIDERIHNIVYKKGVMSDFIIDGKVVGDKTELVNYLLS